MLHEPEEPCLVHRVEKSRDVGVQDEAHFPLLDPDMERVQRIVLAASRPEAVAETEEVFLVDLVQHRCGRPLDQFVFEGCNGQRALPSIRLRNVPSPGGQRAIRPSMNPVVQIRNLAIKVCLVGSPSHPIHAGSGLALEGAERHPEGLRGDVMEERRELLLLSVPCGLPYAVQHLGHTFPVLSPACVVLIRLPLGSCPWLPLLRNRWPDFVREVHCYYGRI